MALKPLRHNVVDTIDFFVDATAIRGGIMSVKTGASGMALDDGAAVVEYKAAASGANPVGLLLNDVVNDDLSQTHRNYLRDEVQVGEKCTLATQGTFATNMIMGAVSPTAGQTAFLDVSGYITNADAGGNPPVGRWMSSKDENGYAKITISLPEYK